MHVSQASQVTGLHVRVLTPPLLTSFLCDGMTFTLKESQGPLGFSHLYRMAGVSQRFQCPTP